MSGLDLVATLDAIFGQMQNQWSDVAIIGNRTAAGFSNGESKRPSAGREIERKLVFAALEHDLATAGSIFEESVKLRGSQRGSRSGLDDGGEGGRAASGGNRQKFGFGTA